MKLPKREFAYVPRQKLEGYLLSETHIVGKSKARFFRMFGFDESNIELLEKGLLEIAHKQDVEETISTPYGKKYVISGELLTPIGRSVEIRTVWIIEGRQDIPRFITAFPV